MDITTAIAAGQTLGSLSTPAILGVLIIVLSWIAYNTYQKNVKEVGEKLDKSNELNSKLVQETKELHLTAKVGNEAQKNTTELLVKMTDEHQKRTQEKLDKIQQKIDRTKGFIYTGTGLKAEN